MKKPVLFNDTTGAVTASTFATNGIGVLSDAISCLVTEELDGGFELVMRYSITGRWHKEIATRRIIYAAASEDLGMQPFRIYRITKPMNGIYTVYAQHYSYDSAGIQVRPFKADDVIEAVEMLQSYAIPSCPFTIQTDKVTEATMELKAPRSLRNAILGEDGSLLSTYKGDLLFDHSTIKLLGKRGKSRGFTIKYGKNMLDLKQEENIQSLYTGIYPYYYAEGMEATEEAEAVPDIYIELPERIVSASGTFGFTRIKTVDFSAYAEMMENPTVETLRTLAEAYIVENQIGVPTVSITTKVLPAQEAGEILEEDALQDPQLGDTVTVIFENLGVNAHARVVKKVYNSLLFRTEKVEIGEVTKRITDTFYSLENTVLHAESQASSAMRNVARLTVETSGNSARIDAVAKVANSASESVAKLKVTTDENSAIVHAIAEVSEDGTVTGKGEFFIKAINGGGSEAYIGADKIAIRGSTTFSSLFTNGTTTIDGSKITANTVKAAQISVDDLSALDATIGGWTIAADRIYKTIEGSESSEDSPCGMYSGDMYTHEWDSLVTSGGTSPIRFYAGGSPVDKTCKFAVLEDGSVYLGAAQISSSDANGSITLGAGIFRSNGETGYIDMYNGIYKAYTTQDAGTFWKITAKQGSSSIGQNTDLVIKTNGSLLVDGLAYTRFAIETMSLSISATHGVSISGTWNYNGRGEILTANQVYTGISDLVSNGTYGQNDTVTIYDLAYIFNAIANS